MARRPATSIPKSDPELPIQAPVEEPILNSPFSKPRWHWKYDRSGKANKIPGRRDASYFWTTQKTGSAQQELEAIGGDYGSDDLPLVNALRSDVERWRDSNYENATQTTKKLLAHWKSQDRKRRLFFCQLEAVETLIYVTEILNAGRKPRWTPAVSPDDWNKMKSGIKPELAAAMTDDFFPRLCDQPWNPKEKALIRYGCKMATGSGKTVVMAMLIAWSVCNRGAVPGDSRFPNTVLVNCPNLTVKERLQVLRPDHGEGNYYDVFDLVPVPLRSLMAQGKVMVTNWHAFAPESPHAEGGNSYAVVNKGEEGADAFARRVLKDLFGRGELMVFNDEAHHAYRPAPPEKAIKVSKKKEAEEAFGGETTDDRAEATVWVEGLDKLNAAVGIAFCVDLSATPFYLFGSGYIPGSPFPWLVSDFGLVDAIESGITKIPRLPVSDESGRPDPKFFRLWNEIKARLKQQGEANFIRGKPKPDAVWREAQPALAVLASQWQERFDYLRDAKPGQKFVPPVLIIVGDNTDIAQVFFEKISGETVEEVPDNPEVDDEEGTTTKVRTFNPNGVPFRDLANTDSKSVTLRIDSKLLAEAETGLTGSKAKEAERLRHIIATVGQSGTAGEHVRCVVSVQMLTEGWDANNVTQILGLRAFGSQLLCEQVVGRGLRRISYDTYPHPETGEDMLRPEYVDVYGIPFSVIPFRGRKQDQPEPDDRPVTHVQALIERAALEIKFPNVEGYVLELKKNLIRCDISKVEPVTIKVMEHPAQIFVQAQVGVKEGHAGGGGFELVTQNRDEYYDQTHLQTILFTISRQVVNQLTTSQKGVTPKLNLQSRHQLFPQVLRIVEEFSERKIHWNGIDNRELGLEVYAQQVVERLCEAIEPNQEEGELPLLPVVNRFQPHGSTADVKFNTVRSCHPTFKSHIDQVVLDTQTWERSVAFTLEASEVVSFYARNDHLEFAIPYDFYGVSHAFKPDFLIRLVNGVTLILEVKGLVSEQDEAKFQAAKRWVSAVNNWGRMGRWLFHACKDPNRLNTDLNYLVKAIGSF